MEVLLGGLVGALLVFLLQFLWEWWKRRQALRGIARLVHLEITHNNLTLKGYYQKPPRALSKEVTGLLRVDTWESVRLPLSDMMPADTFGAVAYYYLFLQELKHVVTTQNQFHDPLATATNLLEQLNVQERDASLVALAYANMQGLRGKRWARRVLSNERAKISEAEDTDT